MLLASTLVGTAGDSGASTRVRATCGIAAAAAFVTGVANDIEDSLDVGAASTVFVLGALTTAIMMLLFAVSLGVSRRPRWSLAVVLMAVGMVAMSAGLGVLVLVGAVAAIRARGHPPNEP